MIGNKIASIKTIIKSSPIYSCKYTLQDVSPIVVNSLDDIDEANKSLIIDKFYSKGFCVIKLVNNDVIGENNVLSISKMLKLGNPFIPEYFNNYHGKEIKTSSGVNQLTASNTKGRHVAFSSNNGQGLHVDGTVAPMGYIKTSILFCDTPASVGGETNIFNSVAAFADMYENNPESIEPLLNEKALMRKHSTEGSLSHYGPVFRVTSIEIVNRFSIDNTSFWEEGLENVKGLEQSFDILKSYMANEEFALKIKLEKDCALVLFNDKISHGRESYIDIESHRNFFRGLFIEKPL